MTGGSSSSAHQPGETGQSGLGGEGPGEEGTPPSDGAPSPQPDVDVERVAQRLPHLGASGCADTCKMCGSSVFRLVRGDILRMAVCILCGMQMSDNISQQYNRPAFLISWFLSLWFSLVRESMGYLAAVDGRVADLRDRVAHTVERWGAPRIDLVICTRGTDSRRRAGHAFEWPGPLQTVTDQWSRYFDNLARYCRTPLAQRGTALPAPPCCFSLSAFSSSAAHFNSVILPPSATSATASWPA